MSWNADLDHVPCNLRELESCHCRNIKSAFHIPGKIASLALQAREESDSVIAFGNRECARTSPTQGRSEELTCLTDNS